MCEKLVSTFRVDVHSATKEGYTPLHLCVQRQNLEMARFLLRNGADPNIGDNVCESRELRVVRLTLCRKDVARFIKSDGQQHFSRVL